MEEKRENSQGNTDEGHENPMQEPESTMEAEPVKPVSRPRMAPDAERAVEREQERICQRTTREVMRTRGIGPAERPTTETSGLIRRLEKWEPGTRVPVVEEMKPVSMIEDRETVKWAAWGALLISVIAIVLVGLYSSQDFEPAIEYHELELTQQRIDKGLDKLLHNTRLEKIENALVQAQFQLLVRKDHPAAEAVLSNAKQDLNALIDSLDADRSLELRQIRGKIERLISKIRQGPSPLTEELEDVRSDFSKVGKKIARK